MTTTLTSAPLPELTVGLPTEQRNGLHQQTHQSVDQPQYVTKAEYWAHWYETEHNYEWNNGYLEARAMSTRAQVLLYQWFLELLRQYMNHHPIDLTFHEIGFSLTIPDPDHPGRLKEVVRKPDIGVIRHDNPVRWQDHERSYDGLFDLCVEALSDSDKWEVERDIKIKKYEYAAGGVQEYYILDPDDQYMHFYQRNVAGYYEEMLPDAEGILRSQVLPGFQFRRSDLKRQPTLEALAFDPVYQDFVLLQYQAAAKQAERERQRAERYAAQLRAAGIVVEDE